LWASHHEAVTRFVARRTDPDLVDDIVAETFFAAWRRIADVPQDALPWLYAVARNIVMTTSRSEARRGRLGLRLAREPMQSLASAEDIVTELLELREAWDELTPGEQETLALVAWDGLSPAQAARVVRCRPAAFAMRLSRARSRLAGIVLAAQPASQPGTTRPELIQAEEVS
jgi:RNA polymerase sigma-70 factor (ECF subfamily)